MRISRRWSLRAIGWAAAYVLALQSILSAFAPLPAAAAAPNAFLILCLSGADHADGGTAPSHPAGEHCAVCLVSAPTLPPTIATLNPVAHSRTIARAEPPPAIWRARSHTRGNPGLPRAPPTFA